MVLDCELELGVDGIHCSTSRASGCMILPPPELDVGWGLVVVLDDDGLASGHWSGRLSTSDREAPKGRQNLLRVAIPKSVSSSVWPTVLHPRGPLLREAAAAMALQNRDFEYIHTSFQVL